MRERIHVPPFGRRRNKPESSWHALIVRSANRILLTTLLVVAACSGPVSTPTSRPELTTTSLPPTAAVAEAYLTEALQVMKANSIWGEEADWDGIEEAMHSKARGAQSPAETYEAIELGLRLLDDPRAVFVSPQALLEHEGEAPDIEEPRVEIRDEKFGYVATGQFIGDPSEEADEFSSNLASQISVVDSEVCGWIVDLRITRFGIPGPVLGGISPLLDRGVVGGLTRSDGTVDPWVNEGTEILVGTQVVASNGLTAVPEPDKPTAVLVGSLTAFPGEVAAMALRGQPNVELFGQPTHGFSLWADILELSDGSVIVLSTGELTDRHGDRMIGGDPLVPQTQTENANATEVVATEWLEQHPSCQ